METHVTFLVSLTLVGSRHAFKGTFIWESSLMVQSRSRLQSLPWNDQEQNPRGHHKYLYSVRHIIKGKKVSIVSWAFRYCCSIMFYPILIASKGLVHSQSVMFCAQCRRQVTDSTPHGQQAVVVFA